MVKPLLKLLALFLLLGSLSGYAQLVVTSNAETGAGTLKDAYGLATNGQTITFSGPMTINFTTPLFFWAVKSVTIDATSAGTVIINGAAIGGANLEIFEMQPGSAGSTIRGITFQNSTGFGINAWGAASGLTFDACKFINNTTIGLNASLAGATGILVNNCTFSGNTMGLQVGGTTNAIISNCTSTGNKDIGIAVNTCTGINLNNSIINTNLNHGIQIINSTALNIKNNYSGTDATGTVALGNKGIGINVVNCNGGSVTYNLTSGNTGSGNYHGIQLINNTQNITVHKNICGISKSGNTPLPNGGMGINVESSSNNTVTYNLIGNSGIHNIQLRFSNNNTISHNICGLNYANNTIYPPVQYGIIVQGTSLAANDSYSNYILNNTVSGSTYSGIYMLNTSGDFLRGNKTGTDTTGMVSFQNLEFGIRLENAKNQTIGGIAAGEGNVSSGNKMDGIHLMGICDGTSMYANKVGLNFTGAAMLSNGGAGIALIGATITNTVIGGNTAAYRNYVTGNTNQGIYMDSPNNIKINGNYIGLNATGLVGIGNLGDGQYNGDGIYGINVVGLTIGGGAVGEGNYIAGQTRDGIHLENTLGAIIKGNKIGLSGDETKTIGNSHIGLNLIAGSHNAIIGGATASQANTIAGNGVHGIQINGSNAATIKGNIIGTNTALTLGYALHGGNGQGSRDYSGPIPTDSVFGSGIILFGTQNTAVGGSAAGEGNIIVNNIEFGIHIQDASNNTIYGNKIGTPDGTTPMGNVSGGIYYYANGAATSNNKIGGAGGNANIIAYSNAAPVNVADHGFKRNHWATGVTIGQEGFGILVDAGNAGAVNNLISQNSIYCNDGLGINLNFPATAYNTGPPGNNSKAMPVVSPQSTTTKTFGTATPGDVVEVYYNGGTCSCQAKTLLGTATADGAGNWSVSYAKVADSSFISATASAGLNTSQITSCCKVFAGKLTDDATLSKVADNGCASGSYVLRIRNMVGPSFQLQTSPNGNAPWTNVNAPFQEKDSVLTVATPVAPGTIYYRIFVTKNNGLYSGTCKDSSNTFKLTVTAPPTAAITGNAPLCAGQTTATLVATGGGTYNWNNGMGTSSSILVSTANTYTVTVTDAVNCTATKSAIVTVNGLPSASISGAASVCTTKTTSLTASGGGNYFWSNALGTSNIVTVGAGTYTVTVTDASTLCTATKSLTVGTFPLTTASITGNAPICNGSSTVLTASGGTSYNWDHGFGALTAITVTTAGTYSVTVTDANNCTDTKSAIITVNPVPSATIAGTPSFCIGLSTVLTAGGGSGTATYTWDKGIGAVNPATVAPAGNTTYTVTVKETSGCTATKSILVTVNPLPVPTIGGNAPFCSNKTVTLTAGPIAAGTSFTWDNGLGVVNPVTLSNPGTYTVTVKDVNGCVATKSATLTVNPNPTAVIGNGGPYCSGDPIALTSSGGNTYSWAGPGGYTSNVQNPVNATLAGTYSVTVTSAANCPNTNSVSTTVVITTKPVATASATQSGNYCSGETITLNAGPNGYQYKWSDNDITQQSTINNATTANSGSYTVTVSNAADLNCFTTKTVVVAVTQTPNAVAKANAVCEGGDITFDSQTTGTGYAWSGPLGFNSALANPTLTNVVAAQSGTYLVTVSNGVCTSSSSVVVNISTKLNPTITGSSFCENSPVQLGVNTPGATYQWTGPGFTSTVQNPLVNAIGTTAMTGTYSVTVTLGTCIGDASQAVVVHANPTPTASNDGPKCTNKDATLTCVPATGLTYVWSGLSPALRNNQAPVITSAQVANSGPYTVTVTDAFNCVGTSSTTLKINSLPPASTDPVLPICNGTSATIKANGGTSYVWDNGVVVQSASVSPNTNTTYNVTVTDANTCTATSSVTVSVNPLPTAGLVAAKPAICSGNSTILTASGGSTYSWTPSTLSTATPMVSPVADQLYTVTVTDAKNCTSSKSLTLSVTTTPTPTISFLPSKPCAGEDINLDAGGPYDSYAWSGPAGFSKAVNPTAITNAQVANNGTYKVTVTVNGCPGIASQVITLNPVVNPAIANISPVCEGKDVVLTCEAGGVAGLTYTWGGPNSFTASGSTITLTNTTAAMNGYYNVTVTGSNCISKAIPNKQVIISPNITIASRSIVNDSCNFTAGSITIVTKGGTDPISFKWSNSPITTGSLTNIAEGTYMATITDKYSCTDTVIVTISNKPCDLSIPNVFTPNGDGKNDEFIVKNLAQYKNTQLTVFNRWGNEIITIDDYDRVNNWNGRTRDGAMVSDGVYFYILKFTNGTTVNGTVTIAQ